VMEGSEKRWLEREREGVARERVLRASSRATWRPDPNQVADLLTPSLPNHHALAGPRHSDAHPLGQDWLRSFFRLPGCLYYR